MKEKQIIKSLQRQLGVTHGDRKRFWDYYDKALIDRISEIKSSK